MNKLAKMLLIVGGINWGLHAFEMNIVDQLLGAGSTGAKVVYIAVALSAIICMKECTGGSCCDKEDK